MTKEIKQCFELLEVTPEASQSEVKRAYREMAKVWHPDRFQNDVRLQSKAQEKLKQINGAYEKLQDFYDNPKAYKSSDTEESKIKKSGRWNSKPKTSKEESKPSRIPEAIIQAEFDKNSTLNSMALGWAIILGSLLIIVLNFF